jgi:MEMO1 family protein
MELDPNFRPKLRNLEPVPVSIQGRPAIGLKDPLSIRDGLFCVQREALPVLALLDGRHSLRDIQETLSRQTGQLVFIDDVGRLVAKLDEACLLDGERFQAAFGEKIEAYRKSPFRPCSHAGVSYSADRRALNTELDNYFCDLEGPGPPASSADNKRPVGLIAPHIDIRAGARCFAHGYHALALGPPSDIYVILGTGHAGVDGLFTATMLDFETPLGMVPTDRDFVSELSAQLGRDAAASEILHATEHVIEFQLIFLQHLFAGKHQFSIVPILCSLSHNIFEENQDPRNDRAIFEQFCAALRKVCQKSSKSICFIASADLDHTGPRYGDSFVPHKGTIADALSKDAEMLGSLEQVDVQGFIRYIARENDSRHICGFSPITTMFHCMDASEGRLLNLDFAQVDERNSFVTFASMIFH